MLKIRPTFLLSIGGKWGEAKPTPANQPPSETALLIMPSINKITIYIAGSILTLLVGGVAAAKYTERAASHDYTSDKKLVENFLQQWNDESKLARQTARIALSGNIARLQELKRVGDSLELKTTCISDAQKNLSVSMTAEIEGMLAFMRSDTVLADQSLIVANNLRNEFVGNLYVCNPALEKDATEQLALGKMYLLGQFVSTNKAKALEWFQKAAIQGNSEAQLLLGILYSSGEGIPKDAGKAMEWFQEAAAQGNAKAQYGIGKLYLTGDGVSKDPNKAMEWFLKADAQNDAAAQYMLGFMHSSGEGTPKDITKAIEWYKKSAQNGYAEAQLLLGKIYLNGWGVPVDAGSAAFWFQQAGEKGNAEASFALSDMYFLGNGIAMDNEKALEWSRKGVAQRGY